MLSKNENLMLANKEPFNLNFFKLPFLITLRVIKLVFNILLKAFRKFKIGGNSQCDAHQCVKRFVHCLYTFVVGTVTFLYCYCHC